MKSNKYKFLSIPIYNALNQFLIFIQGVYIQINLDQNSLNLWAVIVILINLSKSFNAESSQQDFYIFNKFKNPGPSSTLFFRNLLLASLSIFFSIYLLSFYETKVKYFVFLISISYLVDSFQSSKQSDLQKKNKVNKSYFINKIGNFFGNLFSLSLLILFKDINLIIIGFLLGRVISLITSYKIMNLNLVNIVLTNKSKKKEFNSAFNLSLPIFIGITSRQFLDIYILENGFENIFGTITLYLLGLQFLSSNLVIIYDRFTTSGEFKKEKNKKIFYTFGLLNLFIILIFNFIINLNYFSKFFINTLSIKDLSILIFFYLIRSNISILFSNLKILKGGLNFFNVVSTLEFLALFIIIASKIEFEYLGDMFIIFCLVKLLVLSLLNLFYFINNETSLPSLFGLNNFIPIYIIYYLSIY